MGITAANELSFRPLADLQTTTRRNQQPTITHPMDLIHELSQRLSFAMVLRRPPRPLAAVLTLVAVRCSAVCVVVALSERQRFSNPRFMIFYQVPGVDRVGPWPSAVLGVSTSTLTRRIARDK